MKARIQKIRKAHPYHATAQIYNNESLSRSAKLRHYKTVILPEALYDAKCLNISFLKRELKKKYEEY